MTSSVLAYIPSPPQGVWTIGPIPLRAYAFFIIVGIFVAIWWGEKRFVARGGEPGFITDLALWVIPFGLIGGRLYHVMTDFKTYFGPQGNPWGALKVWEGGLGIWGAVALGGVGAWIGCRRKGIPLGPVADALAPAVLLAQAIGRFGNYFNQELYGRPTTLPWGLEIYERVNSAGINDNLNGVAISNTPTSIVHPTFLYEMLWNLLIVGLVVWADKQFKLGHGRTFALYVAGYCVGRFGVELLRDDYATHLFGLRINTYTSAIVFFGAVVYFVLAKKGREAPEALGAAQADPGATSLASLMSDGDNPLNEDHSVGKHSAAESVIIESDHAEPDETTEPDSHAAAPRAKVRQLWNRIGGTKR